MEVQVAKCGKSEDSKFIINDFQIKNPLASYESNSLPNIYSERIEMTNIFVPFKSVC